MEPRAYAVLMALAADDGQSQRQLSARLGIHRNVMVTVIDELERKRLVKRLRHPEDRRAFAITLTDKAAACSRPSMNPGKRSTRRCLRRCRWLNVTPCENCCGGWLPVPDSSPEFILECLSAVNR
ncbi:marR family protein [Mycobacterium kansasii]|uniref:MarR family protein n=1 Tax=Mycobacterium kansasii TaxID=1768 RepID=A0A1V3WP78_MYCKA|nr:marR family protein [Mycobacterium kansasii]